MRSRRSGIRWRKTADPPDAMASAGYRFPAIEGNGPPSWIPGEIRRFHLDDSAESIVWTQCVLSQAKRATRPACRRIGYSGVCIEYVGMRAAYRRSPAKDRPFIPWNKSLIEIEMMGLTAMKKHAHSPRYTPGWGLNGVRAHRESFGEASFRPNQERQ